MALTAAINWNQYSDKENTMKRILSFVVMMMLVATNGYCIQSLKTLEQRKFDADGNVKMMWQDQSTPTIIIPASKVHKFTTLAVAGSIDDTTITAVSAATCAAGDSVKVISPENLRFYVGHQVGALAGNVITLDSPLDFAYPAGSSVACATENMAVDGSSTTQVYSLRAADPTGAVPVTVHITRIIIECLTDSPTSLDKFGNITALTYGLVMRRRDGFYNNIFNIKTGGAIAGIMYDYTPYRATAPEQNIDGFVARLTFAGANKIGVALEVGPNEDLEFLVQDNLASGSPDITSLKITFEGHVVYP